MNEDEKIIAELFEGDWEEQLVQARAALSQAKGDGNFAKASVLSYDVIPDLERKLRDANDPDPDYFSWRAVVGGLVVMLLMAGSLAFVVHVLIWVFS